MFCQNCCCAVPAVQKPLKTLKRGGAAGTATRRGGTSHSRYSSTATTCARCPLDPSKSAQFGPGPCTRGSQKHVCCR
eukprot:6180204-Pleurochrysis_carterae.AAC.5